MSNGIHKLSSGDLDEVSGGWKYFAPSPGNPTSSPIVLPTPIIPIPIPTPTPGPGPITHPVGFI
jgi:hypothetical protein